MPADYKYEFISLGRSKALAEASSRASDLYQDLADSKVIAPEVIERLRVLRLLINRAAGRPLDSMDDVPELEKILGKDSGDERQ
ncbi:MAG: hypothetical protein U1F65_08170 [Verrucomicrobiota bacterium]